MTAEAMPTPIPLRAVLRFVLACWDALIWLLLVA